MSSNRALSALAVAASMIVSQGSAWAASESKSSDLSAECIGTEAPKALTTCPGGPSKFEANQKHAAAFRSAPPPQEAKKRQDDAKPVNPDELKKYAERDTRKTRLQARARQLLTAEISGLERLYAQTKKNSPDRPQLIRRLAEGYVELESAAQRDKIAADIKAQDAKKNKQDAGKFRSEASQAGKIVEAARGKAISYYTKMKNEYPTYSKLDEVLYYLAYEHEQAGDYQNARSVYFELIQKAPKSTYIPNAYLAFGELFFQEAQGDPSKWDLAAAAYQEVIKYPPPNNKVYGYARYKLGYVHWNKGEYAPTLSEFKKVIEYGEQYKDLPNAAQLAKAARRDLIPVYAVSGAPDKAFNFFRPLSGDPGSETTKTIAMLNDLGLNYLDTGHYKEAIVLYKDLLSRDSGNRSCFYQGQITTATQAVFSGDKEAVKKELEQQLRVRADFVKASHPDKDKLECSNKTAELVAETAMSWHLEAVGSGGVRGTGDKKTMDLAAYLYKKVTENFTAQDFAKFQFPRIVKEDWPTMYKIRYAMADLLYFQQRWEECGPAFDSVVDEDPKAPEASEAAYASVLCYQKMYDQLYKGESDRKGKGLGPTGDDKEREGKKGEWEKFKPKPFTDMQKGMVQAFNRYVCYVKPPKGEKEAEEQYVEVKYARARTYFEAQHWEEAAMAFRDVALNHADKDSGIFAAQLYLESVNVLGSRAEPPRPACFDDMARDVPQFLELYCKGQKLEDNKEQCELLTRIQFDIQRLKAQKIVELADSQAEKGNVKESNDNYRKGAESYLELWRGYCEEPLSKGEKPKQCEKANEIVYNMARAYQAARLLAKSIQARQILLNPKYGMNESDLAMKATYEIGGNYQAIAVYDRAAEWFERYAKATNYRGEFADQALSDASVLRLGLGQEDEAIADAANFNKYFGAKKPTQTAQIAFAVAAHYGEKKDWANVEKRLGSSMRLIDSKATLDVRLQAHTLLARAYTKTNKGATAEKEYGAVTRMWADPKAGVGQIEAIEGEDANAKQRRLGRALEAVGEAVFYFAEQKKAKVDKVKFPEYKGAGTKEAVVKHIQTKVKDWIGKKRPLIEDATQDYKKIVDLQPVPPPRWVIAAGSRVGEMWGGFVKEFRAAPIPDMIKKDYELRTAYYGALDDASEPQKQVAKSAYSTCLDYSVKYQYFDEFSRACEEWLAQNYKSEYHLVDEFRGSPNRMNSVLREQGNPLRIGGEPIAAVVQDAGPAPKKKTEEKANADEKASKDKGGKKAK
ncbi:MAG TPA: tetratricopeptide repeat protein [Polyangiaceae bacterium]|nr:tetratricopeptide repeat protein [Polyangiaceae bacterium]